MNRTRSEPSRDTERSSTPSSGISVTTRARARAHAVRSSNAKTTGNAIRAEPASRGSETALPARKSTAKASTTPSHSITIALLSDSSARIRNRTRDALLAHPLLGEDRHRV